MRRRVTEVVLIFVCVYLIGTSLQCAAPSSTKGNWHFSGENIAYKMEAVQTPDSYLNGSHQAAFAVDGDCNHDFIKGTCSHTGSNIGTSPTWTVQFGKYRNLTGIIIINRKEIKCRLKKFTVTGYCINHHDILLYSDSVHQPKFADDVILIEQDGMHACSSISIQIPPALPFYRSSDCEPAFLALCEVQVYAVGCSRPSVSEFGYISPNKTWYAQGDIFTVKCHDGYTPSHNPTVTCCANNTFCDKVPHCEKVYCQVPAQLNNGYYSLPANNVPLKVDYGLTIVGKCNTGYNSSEHTTTRQCQSDATWSGQDTVCNPVRCMQPENVANGYYMYANNSRYVGGSDVYNTSLFGMCNTGYRIRTNSKIQCDQYGHWNSLTPICDIVTCKRPNDFKYGQYDSNNKSNIHMYGAELNVICEKGFTLKSTHSKRTCEESGSWSGDSPVCVQTTCKWPLDLHGGYYTSSTEAKNSDNLPYNTTITAICNDGNRLNNSVTIRQCNEDGMWSNLPPICFDVKKYSSDEDSSLGIIVGVSTGAVIVLAAVTAAVIIIYRKSVSHRRASKPPANIYTDIGPRANSNEGEYTELQQTMNHSDTNMRMSTNNGPVRHTSHVPHGNDGDSTNQYEVPLTYHKLAHEGDIPYSAILLEQFLNIELNEDTARQRFQLDFEKLNEGLVREYAYAVRQDNDEKNRYKNLPAYDHSRVALKKHHEEQSDYINASFVNGYRKPQAYISTKDLTGDTLSDFWRMVWQTNCEKIVILTTLVEYNRSVRVQYWPDVGTAIYGDISVTLQKSELSPDFVIRTFIMKQDSTEERYLTQFHFNSWPNEGVPTNVSAFVLFQQRVIFAPTHRHGPVVVHDSTGDGRIGTFIALDILADQANEMGYVDVIGCVEELRKQQVYFVETLDHYMFLHHALVETLMSTSAIPSIQFPEWFKTMLHVDDHHKKRKLELEFEKLSGLTANAEEDHHTTVRQINCTENIRYINMSLVNDHRPRLKQLQNERGDTTNINAVFLPSYKEKEAFIITQRPLEETKDDFWRLVWEHDIHVIVMINNIHEISHTEHNWPKEGATVKSGSIMIKHSMTETVKHHNIVTLSLNKYMTTRTVIQIQCGGWSSRLPDSTDVILSLLDIVQSVQRKSGNQSVLVHCTNGVDKSGLFCVISAVIERMKIEHDVAINHVIEEMRSAKEKIIPDMEQYEFCHQVLVAYIEEFSTYSNFSL